jgi:AmmeMemoRadiSam system protein B
MFYPAHRQTLRAVVQEYLDAAKPLPGDTPKAIIAPHAGYPYSGPIAGSAFIQFKQDRDQIRRILLLGPSHRVPLMGVATSSADAFSTPLGEIPVDRSSIEAIASLPQVQQSDAAHQNEHSLEVELPFLQELLPECALIPLVVGDASPEQIGACLDRLWGGRETRIVISSDLSHYLDYEAAQEMDRATARKIERLEYETLESEEACGCMPVRGLLYAARKRGLRCQLADLRNSGDTAGSRDRVVGYGAFLFTEPA